MTIDDVRKAAKKNNVHVVVYEYTDCRSVFKVVGQKQDANNFRDEVGGEIPIYILIYFTHSRYEWIARCKTLFMKIKKGLKKRDLILTSTLELPKKPGVYLRYLD